METIAFIAALKQETRSFLRRVGKAGARRTGVPVRRERRPWLRQEFSIEGFPCCRFHLFGRECLLILSGVGLMRAIRATHALFSVTRPQLLVSFGIAGAPQADLRVGDVIVAHTVRILGQESPGRSQVLAPLSETAQQAAAHALIPRGARFFPGIALTTSGVHAVNLTGLALEHPVLEMETAGIAQAAFGRGVPVLALRAVSDSVDEPLPLDLEAYLDKDQNPDVARIIAGVIRRPARFFRLNRLRRNAGRAAENLAVAMLAALEQQLPSL